MAEITFREATPAEFDTVLGLLKEAALWLRERKIDYWQDWISPPANLVAWIKQGFDNNEFRMVEKDGATVGCFRLQWQDPVFWGKQEDNAGYIHSFTISRDLAGQGLGERVLEAIGAHCRQEGKEFLRLDCGEAARGLRSYYERNGFRPVGTAKVKYFRSETLKTQGCDVEEDLVLYEKRL